MVHWLQCLYLNSVSSTAGHEGNVEAQAELTATGSHHRPSEQVLRGVTLWATEELHSLDYSNQCWDYFYFWKGVVHQLTLQ